MSQVKIQGDASGTGIFTIAAPNSNTSRTMTLPQQDGTLFVNPNGALNINASTPANTINTDASGNVGIGTSSPSSQLHVGSSSVGTARITGGTGTGQGAYLLVNTNTYLSNLSAYAGGAYSADGLLGQSSGDLYFQANSGNFIWRNSGSTERMRIDSSGNVGIGTSSPQSLLDLTGNDPTLRLTDNAGSPAATFSIRSADASFRVRDVTNGADRLTIDSSGNVGIGTTSPSGFGKLALQVDGTTTPTNASNVAPSSISLYAATNGGSTNSTVGIFGWQSSQPGIGSGIGFSRENGSDWGSQIRFYTHPTATSNISDLTERVRIAADGSQSSVIPGGTTLYPAFPCRAWVQFNGTGSVGANQTIAGSGNVSSVSKGGTGNYTVNFSTAMPDANYCGVVTNQVGATDVTRFSAVSTSSTASGANILIRNTSNSATDALRIDCAIFR